MQDQGVVIIGAGPAGLAPLFAAASAGRLDEVLDAGVTIVEQRTTVGDGMLGTYDIGSDSSALALAEIVQRTAEPSLEVLQSHPVTKQLVAFGHASAPLSLVSRFLHLAGETLCTRVARHARGRVLRGMRAQYVRGRREGGWVANLEDVNSGREVEVSSAAVLLAMGAQTPALRLRGEAVAGLPLLPTFEGKVMHSAEVLSHGGLLEVNKRLQARSTPNVAIVGGSASAGAVAVHLLRSGIPFGPGSVRLLHRKPLRITYASAQEALIDGYTEFSPEDICPITGVVYRRAGFRLDSRELILRVRGMGGRPREERIAFVPLYEVGEKRAQRVLEEADLIIAAFGYRPQSLPFLDADLQRIALRAPEADSWAVVEANCRLLTQGGEALEGAYGLGLAVGPASSRDLGGERNFHGQVNSLWMWQHTLGLRVVEGVLADTARAKQRQAMAKPHRANRTSEGFLFSLEGAA